MRSNRLHDSFDKRVFSSKIRFKFLIPAHDLFYKHFYLEIYKVT